MMAQIEQTTNHKEQYLLQQGHYFLETLMLMTVYMKRQVWRYGPNCGGESRKMHYMYIRERTHAGPRLGITQPHPKLPPCKTPIM